jgi:hypothetical protein
MKKIGFIAFLTALAIGSIFSAKAGFNSFHINIGSGVRGSGNSVAENRDVDEFSAIQTSGAVNVEVIVQKDYSVTVEADDNLLEHIKTETDGDTLKIYSEGNISPKSKITVKISMPEINSLGVSGASTVLVSNVNSDSIKLKASGASKIKIDGTVKTLESEASGASKIDAENLKAENVDVEANGASSTIVAASNEVHAEASGASNISYTGDAKNVFQKSSGASSVKKK